SFRPCMFSLLRIPAPPMSALFPFTTLFRSLFGLVLAIGLVVDDAIVVVEAVERHIEEGLPPKQAAFKAMEEISGPVIGIALVLRSEEHTSELQSRGHLVCRLLLEKENAIHV